MAVDQINSCIPQFLSDPGFTETESAIDGLDTRLHDLFLSLFEDTTFFAVSADSINRYALPIDYRVEHRNEPTTTIDTALNTAIHNVGDRFYNPSKVRARAMPLREYGPGGWASFFDSATFEVLKSVKLLGRLGFHQHPHDSILRAGGMAKYNGVLYPCWGLDTLVRSPGHWTCIMVDYSAWYDPARDSTALYVLRSELLACIALLSEQLDQRQETDGNHHQGLLKATVVTMVHEGSRILQASCDPSSPSPFLALTFRGTYDRSDPGTGFTTESARNIIRWIIQPDDPWTPGSEETGGASTEIEAPCAKEAIGDRVVSSGSGASQESPKSIDGVEGSAESEIGVVNLLDGLSLRPTE